MEKIGDELNTYLNGRDQEKRKRELKEQGKRNLENYNRQIAKEKEAEQKAEEIKKERIKHRRKMSRKPRAVMPQSDLSSLPKLKMEEERMRNFVEEAFALEAESAKEAGALGFMARALIMATLPHSRVDGCEFERRNGNFSLYIFAPSKVGLPYGSIPRLLTGWVTTEAVKTRQRLLVLGASLTQFMYKLDYKPTGGCRGTITSLKKQMESLFCSAIRCQYKDEEQTLGQNVQIVDKYDLWWTPKKPEQAPLWNSTIELNEKFFQEIITNPVPVDIRALKALKRSPMAMDIYGWLTYRMSYLRKEIIIPWEALQMQFGADYALNQQGVRDFKKRFLIQLKKVLYIYKDAKVEATSKGLKLKPSKTHIPFASI